MQKRQWCHSVGELRDCWAPVAVTYVVQLCKPTIVKKISSALKQWKVFVLKFENCSTPQLSEQENKQKTSILQTRDQNKHTYKNCTQHQRCEAHKGNTDRAMIINHTTKSVQGNKTCLEPHRYWKLHENATLAVVAECKSWRICYQNRKMETRNFSINRRLPQRNACRTEQMPLNACGVYFKNK